jgi:predicted amidohydrolase
MNDLTVTLVQYDILWRDPKGNRDALAKVLSEFAGRTDLVILPETFTSGFCKEAAAEAETMDGPTVKWLKAQAKTLGAAVTGSVQIRDPKANTVYNRLLWADPGGTLSHYDKRHLFRMAKEQETYAPGKDRLSVELKGWRVCPLVCYDLRFPVFARNRFGVDAPGRFDYDLLIFVANWPAARRYSWQSLLRARAIENLAYVAAVNRAGKDGNRIEYAGDSVLLDMLGLPVAELGEGAKTFTTILSAKALEEHRSRFPAQLDADRFTINE